MKEIEYKFDALEEMLREDGYNGSNIVIQTLDELREQLKNCNLQSVNAPLQPVKLICKNCNGWYGININHKCFKCLDDNFVDLNRNGR